jgi:hypothetical protein
LAYRVHKPRAVLTDKERLQAARYMAFASIDTYHDYKEDGRFFRLHFAFNTTAPLKPMQRSNSTAELHAVVPAGMAPGRLCAVRPQHGRRRTCPLYGSYTVLTAGAEDFWAATEDLWTDPQTVHADDSVQLSLNVHRRTARRRGVFLRQSGTSPGGRRWPGAVGDHTGVDDGQWRAATAFRRAGCR